MAQYLQNTPILSGKRNRTATATFVAEPAGLVQRKHGKLILPRCRFSETWWQEHAAGLTLAAPEVSDQHQIVSSAQPGSANQALTVKAKRAVRTRQEQALETATRIAALETACAKVQEEFQNSFTWEERKLIAANSYYTERLAIAKENASMIWRRVRCGHFQWLQGQHTCQFLLRKTGCQTMLSTKVISRHRCGEPIRSLPRCVAM